MKDPFPIQNTEEFKNECKQYGSQASRLIEFVISELDTGWRNLSRRDAEIRKHQLRFLEELQERINSASRGNLGTSLRF